MCSINGCNLPNYENHSECILHCPKPRYFLERWHSSSKLFKEVLAYHLADVLCSWDSNEWKAKSQTYSFIELQKFFETLNKEMTDNGWTYSSGVTLNGIFGELRNKEITLCGLVFPKVQSRDTLMYFMPMLELFGGIEFMDCTFKESQWLKLPSTGVLYFLCEFEEEHSVQNYPFFPNNPELPIFRECTFGGSVDITGEFSKHITFSRIVFEDCKFKGKLELHSCCFEGGMLFNNTEKNLELPNLIIENSMFKTAFKLNNVKTDTVFIGDTEFHQKFEFKASAAETLEINNTNFKVVSDFFESTFSSFCIQKSVFEGFAAFEYTEFGIENLYSDEPVLFKYVTFQEFSNFRHAKFHDGLDIEKSNFSQPPNFLGAGVPLRNTPRETFRIIKHSFDIVGNYIEANQYFSKEMKKYKESFSLPWWKSGEALVFHINDSVSNFGQSYIKPALWLALTLFLVFLFKSDISLSFLSNPKGIPNMNHNILVPFYEGVIRPLSQTILAPIIDGFFKPILSFLNQLLRELTPLNKVLDEGNEFISFILHIVIATLTWQIIVAVKRLTKR